MRKKVFGLFKKKSVNNTKWLILVFFKPQKRDKSMTFNRFQVFFLTFL